MAASALIVLDVDDVPDRADDPGLGSTALAQRAGKKSVLRGEEIREARRGEVHADDAIGAEARLQHIVGVFGLMATVKAPTPICAMPIRKALRS